MRRRAAALARRWSRGLGKLLLDVTQVMDMLGVDAPGLAALVHSQGLPALKANGEIKFHEPDLRKWLRGYAAASAVSPDTPEAELAQAVEHSAERTRQRLLNAPDPEEALRLLAPEPPPPAPAPQDQQVLFDIDVLDALIEQYEASGQPAQAPAPKHPRKPEPILEARPADSEPDELYPAADEPPESGARAIFIEDAFAIRFLLFEARIMLNPGAHAREGVMDDIERTLEDLGVRPADFEQVKKSLVRNQGRWIRLAEAPNPFLNKVNVVVSRDRLRAYLVASATDPGAPISQMNILEELDRCGVRSGIDREACLRVVQERLFGHLAVAAQGRAPAPGRDAELVYHFDRDRALTPERLESGDVDHKSLNAVESVEAGATLVTRIPPEQGQPGEDVMGQPIEGAHGKDARLREGRNTIMSEDSAQLLAARDGHVCMSSGAVHVDDLFLVQGDVDYSTGNIDFSGIVVVRGFVREGFQVNTNGDIHILGGVEGARVITSLGGITIRLGVQGQNKAVLLAEGDVRARFIVQATVEAGGSVIVRESIMHSQVTAGGSVLAQGPKGSIIGGAVRAQESINARFIGSEAHAKTALTLESIDPESGDPVRTVLGKQRAKVARELDSCMAAIGKLKHKIETRARDAALVQTLKANATRARGLNDILARLDEDAARFRARFGPAGARFIRASSMAYPGVHLNIEGRSLIIKDPVKAASFSVDRDDNIIAL